MRDVVVVEAGTTTGVVTMAAGAGAEVVVVGVEEEGVTSYVANKGDTMDLGLSDNFSFGMYFFYRNIFLIYIALNVGFRYANTKKNIFGFGHSELY